MRRARRATLGALIVTLALACAACGDDDESTTTTTTTEAPGDGPEAPAGEDDTELATFCARFGEANLAFQAEEPPPAEEGEALLADIEESAPEEVSDAVETVVAGARELLGGDEEAFDDAFFAAHATIEEYRYESCPTEARIEVTGVEYAFEGAPEEVPAGTVAFKLVNEGSEEHEMVVFARAEGETRPFEELVELPDDEAEEAVRFVGTAFAPPGSDAVLLADLEPGDYAMACFVPVGGAEDGPPHVHEGMLHEFSVS